MVTPAPRLERMPTGVTAFGPFRLDASAGRLWRDGGIVHLRPKTWDVLCVLVANPGRLLTKDDLLGAVWGGAAISDTIPSISVAEIRRALGDDTQQPRYVETVHGRGFRFIAPLAAPASEPAVPTVEPLPTRHPFVGRTQELAMLDGILAPESADCRLVLVAGEAGIGKTTLVAQFLQRLRHARPSAATSLANPQARAIIVGQGQCLAHSCEGYPYWPILGALQDMASAHREVVDALRTHAPSWLLRLPTLLQAGEADALRRRTESTDPGRVVDEMFALLRALAPLVWVFEDLHWADTATLDLLAWVADNRGLDGVCTIGTVRLADAMARAHGIARMRRESRRRGRCREINLAGLGEADVAAYLGLRLPQLRVPAWLPARLLERTGGNPFFLEHTVDHLVAASVLVDGAVGANHDELRLTQAVDAVPSTLRELVRDEIAALTDDERRIVQAASIVGLTTDGAAIAGAVAAPVEHVDAVCHELARRTTILIRGGDVVWPDGTASGRYDFRHALYQKVLYDDQPPALRREAHRRIGRGMARGFGAQAGEVAGVLASHFERGGESERAVFYHHLAAQEATRQHAAREAVTHLRRALALLPNVDERAAWEWKLLSDLGRILPALQGFGSTDLIDLYVRVRGLRSSGADAASERTAMAGLLLANLMQRRPQPAEELAHEILAMADDDADPTSRAYAELLMGAVLYHHGDIDGTIEHAERSLAVAPPELRLGPIEHRCTALVMSGAALWQVGQSERGLERAQAALLHARGADVDPFNVVLSLQPLLAIHQWRGDAAAALELASALTLEVERQGIDQARACAELIEAWARQQRGESTLAAAKVTSGVDALARHGSMMQTAYLLTVAVEVLVEQQQYARAAELLDEATASIEAGEARWWEPELHRWRAIVGHHLDGPRSAEHVAQGLRRSFDLAKLQGAHALHERTAETARRLGMASDSEVRLP